MADDKVWQLAIGALLLALVAMVLDALSTSFEVGNGLWTFLAAFMGMLGAYATIRLRNGNGRNGAR